MTAQLADPGNPTNDWQGTLRAGPLDLVLLQYAVRVCRIDGLIVNSLDQLPPKFKICRS
jgi:adenylosuccinate synthase